MEVHQLRRASVLEGLRRLGPELRARGVARIDLFGSVATDQAGPDSDVDLLVELARPMGFEFFELQDFISTELGVPVELATRGGMRPRVLAEAAKHLVRAL
jgi:hypothetical protein